MFDGVDVFELDQCLVQFNRVKIVRYLLELVLLGQHFVDGLVVVEHIHVFDVLIYHDYPRVIFGQIQHVFEHKVSYHLVRDYVRKLQFEVLLVFNH